MSAETGPLTLAEFEELASLLRRFGVHHVDARTPLIKAVVADTFLAVQAIQGDLFWPGVRS